MLAQLNIYKLQLIVNKPQQRQPVAGVVTYLHKYSRALIAMFMLGSWTRTQAVSRPEKAENIFRRPAILPMQCGDSFFSNLFIIQFGQELILFYPTVQFSWPYIQ